jgi:hypothetical protein
MGCIGALFDKILSIHKKHGPFNLALCIGDFFGLITGGDNAGEVGKLLGGELQSMSLSCLINPETNLVQSSPHPLLCHAGLVPASRNSDRTIF